MNNQALVDLNFRDIIDYGGQPPSGIVTIRR
jgi:hypothetical protein